jgi:hypothetical protein
MVLMDLFCIGSSCISQDERRLCVGAPSSLLQHLSPVEFPKGRFRANPAHYVHYVHTPDLVKLIADDTRVYGHAARLKGLATLQLVSQRVQMTS